MAWRMWLAVLLIAGCAAPQAHPRPTTPLPTTPPPTTTVVPPPACAVTVTGLPAHPILEELVRITVIPTCSGAVDWLNTSLDVRRVGLSGQPAAAVGAHCVNSTATAKAQAEECTFRDEGTYLVRPELNASRAGVGYLFDGAALAAEAVAGPVDESVPRVDFKDVPASASGNTSLSLQVEFNWTGVAWQDYNGTPYTVGAEAWTFSHPYPPAGLPQACGPTEAFVTPRFDPNGTAPLPAPTGNGPTHDPVGLVPTLCALPSEPCYLRAFLSVQVGGRTRNTWGPEFLFPAS
ncbi:MAG: hypothetical protein ACYDBQ_07780 [Thermoplasmatota archaeon]